jgi:hypothetical protein
MKPPAAAVTAVMAWVSLTSSIVVTAAGRQPARPGEDQAAAVSAPAAD